MSVGFSRDRWTEYIRKKVAKGDYSAIVMTQETDVWAENEYGETIADGEAGVDDAEAIQNALNSLTPNRSWKEKVVLKGDFVINSSILIPSYTILDCREAQLKLPSGADYPILKNKNYGDFDEEIEIVGGVFDGNNNVVDRGLIDFKGGSDVGKHVTNIKVIGGYFKNVKKDGDNGRGVWLMPATKCTVAYCRFENCGVAVDITGTHGYGNKIIYNTIKDTQAGAIVVGLSHGTKVIGNYISYAGKHGISVDSGHEVIITNNDIRNPTEHGIALFTSINDAPEEGLIADNQIRNAGKSGIWIGPSPYCNIENNRVYNSGEYGINVQGNSRGSQIIGNKVMSSGYDGIRLHDAHNSVIEGNICLNNGQAGSGYSGIHLEDYANGCVIVGNRCYDDQDTKTQDYGISVEGSCTYVRIKGNICRGNKTANYNITSSGIVICDAIKYTSLPAEGIEIGDIIYYYDGTNDLIAVWNGSEWVTK